MRDTSKAGRVERRTHSPREQTTTTREHKGVTGPSTRKSADERWTDILEASARLFADHGYSSTSLQQIADELDLLKGSLYYYIRSKDDLLYEVIRTVYWHGVASFRSHSTNSGTGMDRLRASIEGHIRHLCENLTATTVFLHEFNQLSAPRQDELSLLDYSGLVGDLIRQGQADNSIRAELNPNLASMFVLGAANWVYRWYQPEHGSIDAIAREFAGIATTGFATTTTITA